MKIIHLGLCRQVYDFPSLNEINENGSLDAGTVDTDLKSAVAPKSIKDRLPFAVVGSNTLIEVGGKKVRARKYPWGLVEVDSIEHCDFIPLRNVLIRSHMQDLKEVTHNCHYEHFRLVFSPTVECCSQIVCESLGGDPPDGWSSPPFYD